jgi:hypothetical protein
MASAWSDVHASTPDQQAGDAPWIELFGGRQDREEVATISRLDLRAARKAEEALWRG